MAVGTPSAPVASWVTVWVVAAYPPASVIPRLRAAGGIPSVAVPSRDAAHFLPAAVLEEAVSARWAVATARGSAVDSDMAAIEVLEGLAGVDEAAWVGEAAGVVAGALV